MLRWLTPECRVSGRRFTAASAFTAAMPAAMKNGSRWLTSAATPPMAGPAQTAEHSMSKAEQPRSIAAAPQSVTAACATDTLAPLAPSMIRARNSSHSEPASPVSRLPTAVPTSDMMITGLRPTRSDSRPVIGENTSCAIENDATNTPIEDGHDNGQDSSRDRHDAHPSFSRRSRLTRFVLVDGVVWLHEMKLN